MCRGLGIFFIIIATMFLTASFLATPYSSWGVDHEQVRPSVAYLSTNFAIGAILLMFTSAVLLLWKAEAQRGWKAMGFGVALLFLGGTAIARLVWLQLYVLA